jgi:hypothetical protein
LANQKTNDERASKFEAKIAEHDEAQKAKGRIFDPQLLIHRAGQIHTVEHPVLGLLRYGELTFEDSFEINMCKTDVEKRARSFSIGCGNSDLYKAPNFSGGRFLVDQFDRCSILNS